MKKIFVLTAITFCLCVNISAQNASGQETRLEELNKVTAKGVHFEVDAYYAPFSTWKTEVANNGATGGKLKTIHSVGLNAAVVYQLSNQFYVGGGTGIRKSLLEWKPEIGDRCIRDAYGLPLYVRGGVCAPLSRNLAGFLNADLGVNIGLEKMLTSFLFDISAGVYYKSAKIGIGIMPYKPKEKSFFGEKYTKGYDIAPCLMFGFRI